MPATLRRLLATPEFKLTLLSTDAASLSRLDEPAAWVHSSDLADPTPFLSSGQVLLTTGTQFGAGPAATSADEYVERLVACGILGLGFGTEVIREGTPAELIEACDRFGMPLFEVPYRTPFIALIRAAADMVAADAYARNTWALEAQGAIARAALRPDGLNATLAELSRQLGHWVALFSPGGGLERVFPEESLQGETLAAVREEATRLVRRGQRASSTITIGGEQLTVQTLGGLGRLRGALALGGSGDLDEAGRDVLTSVIALASLALEQNHALDRARSHLRSGVLHALFGGGIELAAGIAREMWGPLPSGLVRVAVAPITTGSTDAATDWLALQVEQRPGDLFFGLLDGSLIVVLEEGAIGLLDELGREFAMPVGLSDPVTYARLGEARQQAQQALNRALEIGPGVVAFDTVSQQGVLAFLARTNARQIAGATLRPLVEHDESEGTELVRTLRAWLESNGHFDQTARELGVHRHTVRSRVATAERLLGRDLSTFHARADVWAALLAAGDPAGAA
ncbi:PucR family transcriptional regulator [Ruicaihuangia caeni]|uniref:PucR family transcriptional regulator n=1 Tax=Ruicaihuangia caeni TaxID=3042517 RepID=UPI00338E3E5B